MATPKLPGRLRPLVWFTGPVIAIGVAIIVHSLIALPSTAHPLGWTALGVLALVAATFLLKVPGVSAYLSISDTFFITSVLLFGAAPATISIALDSLVMSWRRGFRPHQMLFNPTSSAISLWCGAQVYYLLSPTGALAGVDTPLDARMILPMACMTGVYFLLNSGLTCIAVSLEKRIPALALWRQHFAIISLNYFAAQSASFFLIVLIRSIGVTAIAAVLPLICICYLAMRSWLGRVEDAQTHLSKVNKLYLSTIGAFSTAIEAKDGVTSDHIHRVQAYALGLARVMGVRDPETLQALEAAALLHDTGKLAVPEHILNKPGRLTAAEFETMKSHVDVGADILSSIDFPYPVVPIVRAHHENWDGTGYPRRLRGAQIPIGARILSVVDCFDALTSDRPYRSAMTGEEALAIIVQRRGTMYDPDVVDTFVRVHRDIAPARAAQPQLQHAARKISEVRTAVPPVPTHALGPSPGDVALQGSDELLAFVSLSRVATRTPAVGDIGALAWAHLRQLAPGATLALFTPDSTRTALVAEYTAGPVSALVSGLSIAVGDRVTGWVGANLRPMVNSEARLDLGGIAADEVRVVLAMPLIADGVLAGVMTLYAAEPFADDRSRRLEMITPHLAAAIAAARVDTESRQAGTVAPSDMVRSRPARSDLRVVARR